MRTFAEFWSHYVREHAHPGNRLLHFVGTLLLLALAVAAIVMGWWWVGFLLPVVALPTSELPELVVQSLAERVHDRGGGREVRFDWRNRPALLPVWWEGKLQVLRWGNRDRSDRKLPPTGWTWQESVAAGKWTGVEPVPVEVPASYALMNGVWFKVMRGLRGLVVATPADEPVVYLLCEPSTRYYRVMTRAEWRPVLIGEII